jgi:hypothetical protein
MAYQICFIKTSLDFQLVEFVKDYEGFLQSFIYPLCANNRLVTLDGIKRFDTNRKH